MDIWAETEVMERSQTYGHLGGLRWWKGARHTDIWEEVVSGRDNSRCKVLDSWVRLACFRNQKKATASDLRQGKWMSQEMSGKAGRLAKLCRLQSGDFVLSEIGSSRRMWAREWHDSNYFFKKIIYFWLCWVFCIVWAFSSCGKQGLLIAGASLVAGQRVLGVRASVVVAHGPTCCEACGILLDQGSNSFISRQIPIHCATREIPPITF